ncbi:MAG TPA: SDR family oxidoreductase [Acidimicrobiia bacterium]|nr:SDR family oxidoreductase [Acidimicrobiia bacterium]
MSPSPGRFEGRTALVTGAGAGVGRATALRLAADGAAVIVNDVRADLAGDTVAAIISAGGRARAAPGDVTQPADVEAIVGEAHDTVGPVDMLINNVGGAPAGVPWRELRETSVEDFYAFVALNLGSAFICSRAVIGGMVERGYGKIVCVNSISAVFGQRAGVGYASAKAGLSGFVGSLAKEVAATGVNVNAVLIGNAPHPSRTPEREAVLNQWNHFGRHGRPEEFAGTIAFLVSEDASYLSGSTVVVDGGTLRFALL